jgi:PAS domain S-box-containing protein
VCSHTGALRYWMANADFRSADYDNQLATARAWFAAAEASSDALISIDIGGIIASWNAAAERLFGYPAPEIIGKHVSVLASPELAQEQRALLNRSMERPSCGPFETVWVAKNGKRIDIRLGLAPVRSRSGTLLGISAAVHDIGDKKRAEADLAVLSTIIGNSPDAVISLSPEGKIQSWNTAAERLFGYSASEAIGMSARNFYPADAADEFEAIYRELNAGRVVHRETVRVAKDGTPIDVAVRMAPIRGTRNEVVGVSAVIRDIRERKRAERALRASEERLRAILEGVAVSIWEEDFSAVKAEIDGLRAQGVSDLRLYCAAHPEFVDRAVGLVRIVAVNAATLDMFEAPDEAALRRSFASIFAAETMPTFIEELVALAEGRSLYEGEAVLRTLRGRRVDVAFTIRFPVQSGDYRRVLVSLLDISALKHAEERHQALFQELLHRTKNLLAVVQSIVVRSLVSGRTMTETRAVLLGRLRALSQAHARLTETNWHGAGFADILEPELAPFAHRVDREGPNFVMTPQAAQNFALVIHELVTNAAKHGSLSTPSGRVAVRWDTAAAAGERRFRFRWQESGGPPVKPPTAKGFGTLVLETAVAQDTGSPPRLDFAPDGLTYELDAGFDTVAAGSERTVSGDAAL